MTLKRVQSIFYKRHSIWLAAAPTALYIIRGWKYLQHPLFYAEDGAVWFADAYNRGIQSLTLPLNGFLHTFERLWAIVLSVFPPAWAPLLYALSALMIFALFCAYLFSERCSFFTSTYQKLFVCLSLCLIANVEEFFFNFSNSIFLLGIVGACILLAKPATSKIVRTFELTLFCLLCFTLPFVWIYLFILALRWLLNHFRNYWLAVMVAAGSAAQFIVHFLLTNARHSVISILDIPSVYTLYALHNQIIMPAVRFTRIDVNASEFTHLSALATILLSLCTIGLVMVVAYKKFRLATRYLLIFLVIMTVASFSNPLIEAPSAQAGLVTLATIHLNGARYFIFGILAVYISLAVIFELILKQRYRYIILVLFIGLGLVTSLKNHSFFIDKHFVDYSHTYTHRIQDIEKNSEQVSIPENPVPWVITLRRQ